MPYTLFKVAPTIFTQLFTILGIAKKARAEDEANVQVAVPYVYALLSSKETQQYASVFRACNEFAQRHHIPNLNPRKLMMDFEKSIINAATEHFPNAQLTCCFFHLGQSVYRAIQSEGLQRAYNNPENREVKVTTHMLLALAYVPVDDVTATFRLLKREMSDEMEPIFEYFATTYVVGKPARGKRRAIPPRYPPQIWNQYTSTLDGTQKTNNVSEGWHNRFRLVVGKHHPDLYSAIMEIQKEQADTEITLTELSLGRNVKAAPKKMDNLAISDSSNCIRI